MRTILSRFSKDFCRGIEPLFGPLEAATEPLAGAEDERLRREVLPELRELRHQLQVLRNKVADQNAFVLIFGPLKSGKSTLMNALAAAYVSEVSTLPAYPCMVYVGHADTRSFQITRYDGATEVLTDLSAIHMHIQRAHVELANAIRRTEEAGEQFDPAIHFPEAIRRIDARMPAGDLAESGAMLVDTPGLYSRMKFGYDRMTREFRDAAACAIFVVKTDNLFLEQVFEEFNELLELFSRIFLVINVDSTKMDLGSKGELVPSLEQQDPLRIVEAFESFAMSAPLKRAAESGTLKIYPIDLLRSARRRLRREPDAELDPEDETGSAGRRFAFENFQGDLASFLNSTDYLVAFMGDSLRRGSTLLAELLEVCEHPAIGEAAARLETRRRERADVLERRQAVRRLSAFGWKAAFDDFEERLGELVRAHVREEGDKTSLQLDRALEEWFKTDASLQSLVESSCLPILHSYRVNLFAFVQDALEREAREGAGGIQVTSELRGELRKAEIDPGELARTALTQIKTEAPVGWKGFPLSSDDIPVKKSLLDWLLFRRSAAIRRRLFGPPERPSLRIPAAEKGARLAKSKAEMARAIDRFESDFFAQTTKQVRGEVLAEYSAAMARALEAKLAERRDALESRLGRLEREVEGLESIRAGVTSLREEVEVARDAVLELREDPAYGAEELVPFRGEDALALEEDEVAAERSDEADAHEAEAADDTIPSPDGAAVRHDGSGS